MAAATLARLGVLYAFIASRRSGRSAAA